MAKLTDDADYYVGETSANVPIPRFDAGHYDNYYGRGLGNIFVPPNQPDHKTKLRSLNLTYLCTWISGYQVFCHGPSPSLGAIRLYSRSPLL
ncbi:unnamed protein product [Protopolystoma xenopodis]|uniref:Uncharacterized protein n=1 Tax=Protopolystoma xenopodis TaxID=117903 RepID=A0A3S5AKJ4_9PLAT|nr:unnamed protein product [Protopolystoma xenopodis]